MAESVFGVCCLDGSLLGDHLGVETSWPTVCPRLIDLGLLDRFGVESLLDVSRLVPRLDSGVLDW